MSTPGVTAESPRFAGERGSRLKSTDDGHDVIICRLQRRKHFVAKLGLPLLTPGSVMIGLQPQIQAF
jgi:hypothetical protein